MVGRADKAVAYGEGAIFAVGGERNPQCSGSAPQDDVEKLGVYLAVWKSTRHAARVNVSTLDIIIITPALQFVDENARRSIPDPIPEDILSTE